MSRGWMPFYVADYLADTGHLTVAEHGAYLLLIMHYWQRGSLPKEDDRLSSIARAMPEQWLSMKPTIAAFFDADWRHERIEAEIEKSRIAHEKRKLAGKKGGSAKAENSSNAKAMLEQCSTNHNHNHIISSTDTSYLSSAEPSATPDPPPEKIKISRKADPAVSEMVLEIGLMWNELADRFGLPRVEQITPARRSSLLARSRELTASHDFTDPLEGFRALFEKVFASRFLIGASPPRKDGGPPFRASFDWVIKQSNFQKIMEGNYENSNRPQTGSRVQPFR